MMNLYDHRFATYEGATGMTIPAVTDEQHDDPTYEPLPRYWVAETDVEVTLDPDCSQDSLLVWRWITASTNERTFLAGPTPTVGAGNSLVLSSSGSGQVIGLVAAWASLVMDSVARGKLTGSNMAFFIVKQFACPPPSTFEAVPQWLDQPLSRWLAPRVVELSYTSHAMAGFAREVGDAGQPYRWVPPRRQQIRAEIDAAMFHLYGLDRGEVEHVLDSFSVLKRYDLAEHGEFRTKLAVLRFYDAMAQAAESSVPYVTSIEPPPGLGQRHESEAGR